MEEVENSFWREVHRDLVALSKLVTPVNNEMLRTASGHALAESLLLNIDLMKSRVWGHMAELEREEEQ